MLSLLEYQTHPMPTVKRKADLDQEIEFIFQEIFALEKKKKLGLFGMVAHYAYEMNEKALHIRELKEQIYTCRENMEEVYGRNLIDEIYSLPVKFRKLKRKERNRK